MIKTCLFDLDGTLLDTLTSIRHFLNVTSDEFSLPRVSLEDTRVFVGKGAKNLVDRVFEKYAPDECDEVKRAYLDYYVSSYDNDPYYLTKPYDGIPELIRQLRERGITLAVISNKPDPTVKQLIRKFFGDAFDVVEGGRAGVPLKPDPTAALDICQRLGVHPASVAYVGDTGTDMRTGVAMGASHVIGVGWGFRDVSELLATGATDIVNSPSEIADLLA